MAEFFLERETGRVFQKNPDGSYEFVKSVGGSEAVGQLQPEKSLARETASKVQRTIEGGAKRALTDFPGALGDVVFEGGQLLRKITGGVLPEIPMMRPSQALRQVFQVPQPQGFEERMGQEVLAGAGSGAMLGPLSLTGASLRPADKVAQAILLSKAGGVTGGAAGAGGEIAGSLTGDNPYARFAGAMTAGGLSYPAAAATAGGPTAKTVQTIVGPIADETFEAAKRGIRTAADEGVRINAAQALPQPTPLTGLVEFSTRAPRAAGEHITRLQEQGGASRSIGERLIGMFKLGRQDPVEVAEGAQKAATATITAAEKMPPRVTKDLYAFTTKEIPQDLWTSTARQLINDMKSLGVTAPAGKFIRDNVLKPIIDGKLRDPAQIDSVIKGAQAKLGAPTLATEGIDDRTAGLVRGAMERSYGKMLSGLRVDEPRADILYKSLHEKHVDPLYRGTVGKIAGKRGFDPQEGSKVDQILNTLSDPNIRAQSIARLQEQLDYKAPGTFARLAQAGIEKKLEAAFKGQEGSTPMDAPARFVQALRGGPDQRIAQENFRATMAASAKSLGKSPAEAAEFVRGAERMLTAIEMAGRGKGVAQTASRDPLVSEAVKAGGAVALYPPQATGVAARLTEMLVTEGSRRKIFDMLWTPEGVEKIRQFARMSIPDIRAAAATGALFESAVQSQEK